MRAKFSLISQERKSISNRQVRDRDSPTLSPLRGSGKFAIFNPGLPLRSNPGLYALGPPGPARPGRGANRQLPRELECFDVRRDVVDDAKRLP
jgi:hypothetical protein